MNSARRLIVNNTAVQLFGKFFSTLTTLLTTLLITRFLGAEVYGDFTKVFSTVILLYMVLDFGFNAIVVRRLGLRPAHLSADISNLIVMRLLYAFILSLLLSLFLLASPTPATHGYTLAVKQATLIFSLSFFFQGIFTSLNAVFQHRLNYLPSVLSGSLGNLLILIFTALAAFFAPSLSSVIAAQLAGSIIMALLSFIFVRPLIRIRLEFDWSRLTSLFLETLPLGIMITLNTAMIRLDSVILTLSRPTLEVGWYGLSYRLYETILVLPLFFINAIYPLMIRRHQLGLGSLRSLVISAEKILLLFSLALAPLIFIFSPLLSIFGPRMLPAVPALRFLSLFLPIFFTTALLQWTLITLRREKLLISIYGLGLVFNFTINLLFIPRLGYLAAAVTSGLTEVLILLLLLPSVLKSFRHDS